MYPVFVRGVLASCRGCRVLPSSGFDSKFRGMTDGADPSLNVADREGLLNRPSLTKLSLTRQSLSRKSGLRLGACPIVTVTEGNQTAQLRQAAT